MNKILKFFKSRKPDFWYRVIICICILVFGASLTKLIMIFQEYKAGEDEYQDIEEEFVTEAEVDTVSGVAVSTGEGVEVETVDKNGEKKVFVFKPLNVDFAHLKAVNKDVIGWIQFESFELSYPIVKDTEAQYYLRRTFKKTKNSAGSIFVGPSNHSNFYDSNTIIFGHNMHNGSMFGQLKYYKNKSFFQGNQFFRIYTPNETQRYQIFSVFQTDVQGIVYSVYGDKNSKEYLEFLKQVKKSSMYDTGVSVAQGDSIVTLSTCLDAAGKSEKRLVVVAKRIS